MKEFLLSDKGLKTLQIANSVLFFVLTSVFVLGIHVLFIILTILTILISLSSGIILGICICKETREHMKLSMGKSILFIFVTLSEQLLLFGWLVYVCMVMLELKTVKMGALFYLIFERGISLYVSSI